MEHSRAAASLAPTPSLVPTWPLTQLCQLLHSLERRLASQHNRAHQGHRGPKTLMVMLSDQQVSLTLDIPKRRKLMICSREWLLRDAQVWFHPC